MQKNQSKAWRICLWIVGSIVLCAAFFGAGYGYWVVFHHRFWTVSEEKVYRSGGMPVPLLEKRIKQYGIKTIIDLRKAEDQKEIDAEHQAMLKMGVTHINLPSEQAPDEKTVAAFLNIMDQTGNRPVLIHCHHGEGRAVLFSAIYRMEYEGWDNERARRASRLILWRSSFSAERTKGKYLQNYIPRVKRKTITPATSPISNSPVSGSYIFAPWAMQWT